MSLRYDFFEGGEVPYWKRLAFGCVLDVHAGKLEHYVMARIGRRIFFLAWPTDTFREHTDGRFYTRSWCHDVR